MNKFMWEVNQTTDGYHCSDLPSIGEFEDYEEAVTFLYTNNKNNEKKLRIDSVKV
jgi:hypothetical protein